MPSESFIIREITGSQRLVELKNRALPYRPVEWPGEQHYIQKWYAGNRQATIQVLGPREGDVEIRGTWKQRFISEHVETEGFEDLITPGDFMTPEILVKIFHRIRRAGNQIEVSWGPEVRRGILAIFRPNYQRIEDIEWSMRFVWSQTGDERSPRATQTTSPEIDLTESLAEIDALEAEAPSSILPTVLSGIQNAVSLIRNGTATAAVDLATIFGAPAVPQEDFQRFERTVAELITDTNTLIALTITGPYLPFIATDPVELVLAAETWRRDLGAASLVHQVNAINARESVRRRVVPGFIRRETVRVGETLRGLAYRVYGSADNWTLIADANDLVSAVVPAGTTVVIPQPPQSGSGVGLEQ